MLKISKCFENHMRTLSRILSLNVLDSVALLQFMYVGHSDSTIVLFNLHLYGYFILYEHYFKNQSVFTVLHLLTYKYKSYPCETSSKYNK